MESLSHDLPEEVHETLRLIGRKWSIMILHDLTHEPMSFGELRESIKGISASVLSDLLNEFMDNDIVEKRVISVSPNRSAYFISDFGQVLCDIIENIMEWGTSLISKRSTRVSVSKD